MSFFTNYQKTIYNFDSTVDNRNVVVNVLTSARFVDLLPERSDQFYVDYIVKDEEKPEHIADRVYGRSDYHWIILMANKVYNPYFDWPMSNRELVSYIENKYQGVAIFFDCIGDDATKFRVQNSNTMRLSEAKSHFIVGNTVTQTQGSRTITATITEWNPTYRKLVVNNASGVFSKEYSCVSKNVDGRSFEVTPKKIVQENAQAVHHFVDDFNNILDPYGKINYYEYDDHKIYSKKSIYYLNDAGIPTTETIGINGTNDFILNKYINDFQGNAVTNAKYESNQNEKKRQIKILKIEYIPTIIANFETIFQ
jgi:hypothetical protein